MCNQPGCSYTTPVLRVLTKHAILHSSPGPHACTKCSLTFQYKNIATRHIRRHDRVDGLVWCRVCETRVHPDDMAGHGEGGCEWART